MSSGSNSSGSMSSGNRVEVVVPTIGESIATAFISRWTRQVGEHVQAGEVLFEVDSDKTNLEVPSPAAGRVVELRFQAGDEVAIGAVVAILDAGAAPAATAPAAEPAAAPAGKGPQTGPAARAAAASAGVDVRDVEGSGVRGRVLSKDVARTAPAAGLAAAPAAPPAAGPAPVAPPAPVVAAPAPSGERVERVPMSPLRRTIARRLVEAQHTAAMLTTFNEVDMGRVMELRKRYQDRFVSRHGQKIGFMSFFVKAVIDALRAFPAVNAEIDDRDPARPAVLYKRYYNIGVAVSTPRGLMVPVVRDADRLSFAEVEKKIGELSIRGRDNKLGLEDFADGTFTISNGGVFGSLMSTPILNPPQVGILGMHAIQDRPVAVEGRVEIRPMMYLALSYDHRIIDGKEAVSFLVRVKECVENPERMLLEV